ncbi:ATP-dependent Zn protease [Bradyrhizobium sp. F1.13.1]
MSQGLKLGNDRTYEEDFRIAVHEAGHAIVGWYNGRSLDKVTIEPETHDDGHATAGYVRYGPQRYKNWNSEQFSRLLEHVAGMAAEYLCSLDPKALRGSDRDKAYFRADDFVTNKDATELLIAAAEVEARHILLEHYPVLKAMALELIQCRTMDGATALAFIDRAYSDMTSACAAAVA